jgi:hypothetical protein
MAKPTEAEMQAMLKYMAWLRHEVKIAPKGWYLAPNGQFQSTKEGFISLKEIRSLPRRLKDIVWEANKPYLDAEYQKMSAKYSNSKKKKGV